MREIAATVFGLPVTVPAPGEYVADGAARQAAWVLTGERPEWPLAIDATLPAAPVTGIRSRYAAAAARAAEQSTPADSPAEDLAHGAAG